MRGIEFIFGLLCYALIEFKFFTFFSSGNFLKLNQKLKVYQNFIYCFLIYNKNK